MRVTSLGNDARNWNVQLDYGSNDIGYTDNLKADYKGTYGEGSTGCSYDKIAIA